jgi:hypothetical protein
MAVNWAKSVDELWGQVTGISVFYAGLDLATAKAETTANLKAADRRLLTAAKWSNTRTLQVLDLSRLPEPPDFYARKRYIRDQLMFLESFCERHQETRFTRWPRTH